MILRLLETENFLTHESTSVAFPESGIFLLSGPSGSGKSSLIIDAIAYALFGAVATRAKKQQDLQTKGCDSKMSVRVTFDFSPDRRITVARGLDERGSSWAEVYEKDGKALLAEGSAPVARFIRSELGGMIWQQFYAAFVARQSEISMLTSLRGSERKNLVQRMLGMRELEKTADIISESMRRYSAEIDQLESGFTDQGELRKEEISRLQEEATSLQNELGNLEKDLLQTNDTIKRCQEAMKPLLLAVEAVAERERSLLKIDSLEKEKEMLEGLAKQGVHPADLPDLQKKLLEMKKKQDLLRDDYRRATEKEGLEKEKASLPTVQETKDLESVKEDIRSGEQNKKRLEDDIRLFLQRGRDLQETGSCDLCRRPFVSEEEKSEVEKTIGKEIERAREDIINLDEQISLLRQQLPALLENEKKKNQLDSLNERLESFGHLDPAVDIADRGQKLGEEIEDLERKIATCQMAKDNNLDIGRLGVLEEEIEQRKQSLPSPASVQQELQEWEARERAAQGQRERISGRKEEIEKQLQANREALRRHKEAALVAEKEKQKIDRVRQKLVLHSQLQEYLKGYQKHLAHEIRPALEEIGSEMMRRISGGQHRAIHLNDNYEIELETSSGKRIAASMVSGGEAVRASLCLRLALTRLVSSRTGVPLGFLILDEPLPAQDPGHIERIMELLNSLRPFYQQQFIISHVGNLAVSEEVDYLLQFGDRAPQLLRA